MISFATNNGGVSDITFAALGSTGTYGHLSIASEFARICKLCQPDISVHLVVEDSPIPQEFLRWVDRVTILPSRPQACSRGGSLNAVYDGPDIDELVAEGSPTWIFSTFFDPRLVTRLRASGTLCVWLGHPMRTSFWELFLLDRRHELFDTIALLDDVHRNTDVRLESSRLRLLPPTWSVPDDPEPRAAVRSDDTLAVACGGGVVNGSDAILESSVKTLESSFPHLHIVVFPGAVRSSVISGLPDRVEIRAGNFAAEMSSCSAVICQAGYNTVQELIFSQTPAVLVPAPRLIDDQELRAVLLARQVGVPVVLPSELTRLTTCVNQIMGPGNELVKARMRDFVHELGWDRDTRPIWSDFLSTMVAPAQSGHVEIVRVNESALRAGPCSVPERLQ